MKNKSPYRVTPDAKVRLRKFATADTGGYKDQQDAAPDLEKHRLQLDQLQDVLYAEAKHALLVVLQGMDTGGKDGTIRHIFSGVNPQGCDVTSFKVPTPVEAAHDFLWRAHLAVPRRGMIGIFNRSHYEDVLVTRVHGVVDNKAARHRFDQINAFEQMLFENGVAIVKFFLHISREEQTARLRERCQDKNKHWKISESDFHERVFWPQYQAAYEDAIGHTSQKHAPWFIIPADHKWYRNVAISRILVDTLRSLKMRYPQPSFDVSKLCNQL
jgi:PPK2 family polyphosphate:nucleotide phosphotransferase